MHLQTRIVKLVTAALFASASAYGWCQAHATQNGPYELRASTVVSTNLAAEPAREHGIERDPNRGVLNVTLIRHDGKAQTTVQADVRAYARSLTGRRHDISLQETNADGYVSYIGTYDFVNSEVLDFTVSAMPPGKPENLTLTFRERMWAPASTLPQQQEKTR